MIQLYDLCGKNNLRFSPPCWNIKLCLLHKKIDFETIPVRFSEKNKIAFSGQGLVPIVKHNKGFVFESWNIIEWLEKNYTESKLFKNESSKNFSYFLYFWTSRQLLPILFKIIAHEIPNILEGEDINYYIKTREERINGPITKFKPYISDNILEFKKMISPVRKLIEKNGFISGKNPGLEDYIFYGNFRWVYSCSSCELLDTNDIIYDWYKNLSAQAEV
ncbi:MAG: glutathione S-transferase N-terminal domain-containing protein [Proteobacteria bacterium]|nr:glutathione S-transferase N-terminal domain-containing protein [Pseudomonadota bacterium]